jgi:hypothetical protein
VNNIYKIHFGIGQKAIKFMSVRFYFVIDIVWFTFSVVDCATESDMLRALEKLDGMDINGKKIRLVEERGGSSSGGGGRDRGRRR